MILHCYSLQFHLYEVLSNPGKLLIDVIDERLYITQQTSDTILTMFPYDTMEEACDDMNTINKLKININI